MAQWEVTITTTGASSTPPTLRDIKNSDYEATPEQVVEADRILKAGRRPQTSVTDEDPAGELRRPPLVLRVF